MNNPFNPSGWSNVPFGFPQQPRPQQGGQTFNSGQDQLTDFLLGAKIAKVEHGPRNELILTLDKARGRVIISGQTNIHMESTNANTEIIDVEARESKS
jgi:hypothetical protein